MKEHSGKRDYIVTLAPTTETIAPISGLDFDDKQCQASRGDTNRGAAYFHQN